MSLMINELVEFPIGIEKNYKLFQQRKPNLKKIENLHCGTLKIIFIYNKNFC